MNRTFRLRWQVLLLAAVLTSVLGLRMIGSDPQHAFTAEESRQYIERYRGAGDFVILDVRTPDEYAGGHIANAVLLDFYKPGFELALQELDKDKTYLIYCRSGNRSGKALAIARNMGFRNVYHMAHGLVEWQAEGYPLAHVR